MLKSVFYPNKSNSYVWLNVFSLILLVAVGKIDAYAVLFGYFFETLIIGFFNIIKMFYAYKYNDGKENILFKVIFFIIHFGGFIAIQSIFMFAIFSIDDRGLIRRPFNLVENYSLLIGLKGVPIVLCMLFITQLVKLFYDFLVPKKYLYFTVDEIMFKPYFRIIIQQFTVIISVFFMVFSTAPILSAMLLILLRFIVDFIFVSIKKDSVVLDYIVDKIYDGKIEKSELRKQILLLTE